MTVLDRVLRRVPFIGRLVHEFSVVNVLDCATRLAAQAFLGALPALFVIAAFAPQGVRDQLVSSLHSVLGLHDDALDQVRQVYSADDTTETNSIGIVGVIVTLLSATACSRALQRTCERAWRMPRAGARLVAWRWVVWLAVWLVDLLLQGPLHDGFGVGAALGVPLQFVSGTLLWWWTQRFLLGSRIPWPPLLPGAMLVSAGVLGVVGWSAIYMPGAVERSLRQFGPFGSLFVLLSWLIVLFTVITIGICVGYVIAHEKPVARRLGTPPPPAPPSGPAAPSVAASGP
ncbi:YhjD/YihY/BrkB family envelope integrity protein [Streptomyces sp. RKAG337]|uniref:YhjD/YihY/BrkB family envelope integrity protein n=1 Tax=Streptomyces sp. RKAG337 TaxID=2893404 RepID=UPI002033931E|nr:YhjD/YihY/BrkB family envelope integrity protein [Streptomyces sp. RKAG337]MCM2427248.1 YihY/virulence factor BrkB family protein [Streptomyces sp. RKAG337]